MFRERAQLPAAYYVAAQPCVEEVRAELAKLRGADDYDATSVEDALRRVGLTAAYARQPGRLDLGGGTGVVFSASPGAGCIVGHHSPDGTIGRRPGQRRPTIPMATRDRDGLLSRMIKSPRMSLTMWGI